MDVIIGLLVFSCIYFLPTIIAAIKKHKSLFALFLFNLFFGFTGYGLIAAFYFAFSGKKPKVGAFVVFLLIVILLAIIGMPGLRTRKRAYDHKVATEDLRALSIALEDYAKENAGEYPSDGNVLKSSSPEHYVDICEKETRGHAYSCSFSSEGYRIIATGKPGLERYSTFTIETGGVLTEDKPLPPE